MKAILIVNPASGRKAKNKELEYIKNELSSSFEVFDIKISSSREDFIDIVLSSSSKYDSLIIFGGDGSINLTVNVLAPLANRPILGFIPHGTLNDAFRNLDLSKRFKRSVAIIKRNNISPIDIIKVNESYATYVATFGAYSDLPYVVNRREKKIFRRFAYYFHAVPRVFKKVVVKGKLIIDDQEIDFITPFMLLLNGKRMGGFNINKNSRVDDGVIDIIYHKPSIFNSLGAYFFNPKSLTRYKISKARIILDDNILWEIDGEKGPLGSVNIEVKKHHFNIYK